MLAVNVAAEEATITNAGDTSVNLENWALVSVVGNQRFTFTSNLELAHGASVVVTSGPSARTGTGFLKWTDDYIWRKPATPGNSSIPPAPSGPRPREAGEAPRRDARPRDIRRGVDARVTTDLGILLSHAWSLAGPAPRAARDDATEGAVRRRARLARARDRREHRALLGQLRRAAAPFAIHGCRAVGTALRTSSGCQRAGALAAQQPHVRRVEREPAHARWAGGVPRQHARRHQRQPSGAHRRYCRHAFAVRHARRAARSGSLARSGGRTAAGATDVVVLSDGLWREHFAGEPSAIGRSLVLDGRPHTIVGIAEPRFYFPSRETRLWTPLAIERGSAAPGAADRGGTGARAAQARRERGAGRGGGHGRGAQRATSPAGRDDLRQGWSGRGAGRDPSRRPHVRRETGAAGALRRRLLCVC